MRRSTFLQTAGLTALAGIASTGRSWGAQPLGLQLPTKNDALFSGNPSKFYMFTDRTFEGVKSTPWQAGGYGYVRNPKRSQGSLVYTRFHEGIDIAPVSRDARGEPQDTVSAIAPGKVVFASSSARHSNYGNYVVVQHDWGYGPFFSLYAHLNAISASVGQPVSAGTPLGRLGYTGAGIDRRRAHLHLEFNLMLSAGFEKWHQIHFTSPNHNGIYNGLNLAGLDVAGLLRAAREDPALTVQRFMARMETYYMVATPRGARFDLVTRYPWLAQDPRAVAAAPSLEISFSRSGVPLRVAPSQLRLKYPSVTKVKESPHSHAWNTNSRLTGSGGRAALSPGGSRYVQLVSGDF
ncbi:hypothetical protein BH23VER1_BH23VER1_19510 [soil metagenome]